MRSFVKYMKNIGAELHVDKHVINNVQTLSKSCLKPNKTVKPTVEHLIWVSDIFHNKSWQNWVPRWPNICPTPYTLGARLHSMHSTSESLASACKGTGWHIRAGLKLPDCKVCHARRRSSPRTFGCVREKYIGYMLSAQYFAENSICRIEKHSKCKILKAIG